jgi:hypothetical protein
MDYTEYHKDANSNQKLVNAGSNPAQVRGDSEAVKMASCNNNSKGENTNPQRLLYIMR